MFRQFTNKWPLVLCVAILALATILRFYNLELRPLHNDEAVNNFFLERISELGYYPYSHENYHGPLYFYLTWPLVYFINDSEFTLRLSAVLFGIGCLFLPLMLLRVMGWRWVLFSQVFIGFSASSVFYHRYAIHETLFIFCTVWLAFAILRYSENRQRLDLFSVLLAMAGLVCLKETYIIPFLILGICSLYVLWKNHSFPKWREMKLPIFVFLIVIIFCYTGGLQWSKGIRELALSVPQWLGRNDSDVGHFKPWGYYLQILWGNDLLEFVNVNAVWRTFNPGVEIGSLLFVFLLPLVAYLMFKKRELPTYAVFGFLWLLLTFVIYSFPVKYKTPWLVLNISYPLYFYLAWQIDYIYCNFKDLSARFVLIIFILVAIILNSRSVFIYNFQFPYQQEKNPLAYVHTHPAIRDVTNQVIELSKINPEKRVLIDLDSTWPIPYYFRHVRKKLDYLHKGKDLNNCQLLKSKYYLALINPSRKIDCPDVQSKSYKLSDNILADLYYFTESKE